jgi:hypothetical protein
MEGVVTMSFNPEWAAFIREYHGPTNEQWFQKGLELPYIRELYDQEKFIVSSRDICIS